MQGRNRDWLRKVDVDSPSVGDLDHEWERERQLSKFPHGPAVQGTTLIKVSFLLLKQTKLLEEVCQVNCFFDNLLLNFDRLFDDNLNASVVSDNLFFNDFFNDLVYNQVVFFDDLVIGHAVA